MPIHNLVESVEQRTNLQIYSIVVFTSDEEPNFKQREEFVVSPPTPENLTSQVTSKTIAINNNFVDPAAYKALLNLQGTEIPVSIPSTKPTDPPTPEEIAKNLYGEKVVKYKEFKGAMAVGIDVKIQFDAIVTDLIKDYLPGYEVFFTSIF